MSKIIGAVPNICEGKDEKVINEIVNKVHNCNAIILDVSRDTGRNRTVISFAGEADALFKCGMVLYEETLKRIDMRNHKGNYPRIGAVDVFPFVPLKDVTIEETIELSERFAEEIAKRFKLPVYLFGQSARRHSRRNIENIRSCEYEGLEEQLKDPAWRPDYGPIEFKPDSGATVIGARYPLISFKVLLSTDDVDTAESICSAIASLRHVNVYDGENGRTKNRELTVSITDYRATPMYRVMETAKMEAKRFGVAVQRVEMIGLIPEIAFIESALFYLNIKNFPTERLLEKSIEDHMAERMPME